jgi:hypothetical protein
MSAGAHLRRALDQLEATAAEPEVEPEAPAIPPDLVPLLPWLRPEETAEIEIANRTLRRLAAAEAERRRRREPAPPEARAIEIEAASTIVALARLADMRRASGRDLVGRELLAAIEAAREHPPSTGSWWRR